MNKIRANFTSARIFFGNYVARRGKHLQRHRQEQGRHRCYHHASNAMMENRCRSSAAARAERARFRRRTVMRECTINFAPHSAKNGIGSMFLVISIAVWKIMFTFANGKLGFWNMSTQDIKTTIAEYFKTQPVLRAWLFGSFARGEETSDSDVDFLVEFDHSSAIGLLAYARMWRELKEKLGRDVDLVEDGTMRPLIAESANYDRQLIYERAI